MPLRLIRQISRSPRAPTLRRAEVPQKLPSLPFRSLQLLLRSKNQISLSIFVPGPRIHPTAI